MNAFKNLEMCPKKLLVLCTVFVVAYSGDKHRKAARKPKFISFNAVDDDIEVSLDFTIPFVTIPIKKAVNAFGVPGLDVPNININPSSLALGGAMILASGFLLPLITKKFGLFNSADRFSRVEDAEADTSMIFTNKILSTSSGCPTKIACLFSKDVDYQSLKNLKQLMSNKLLSTMVNSTAIEDAISTGYNGQDCEKYSPCFIKEEHLPILKKSLRVLNT